VQFKKFQDVLCAFEVILIFVMKFQIIFILQFCAAGLFEKSMTEFVRTGLFAFFLENRANGSFVYHNVTPFFSFPKPSSLLYFKKKTFWYCTAAYVYPLRNNRAKTTDFNETRFQCKMDLLFWLSAKV